MAPSAEPPRPICSPGEEEANAEGNSHEKIAGEVVPVEEGSRNRRHPLGPIQIEDVTVAAEEFEYPVKGFENADDQDDNNQVIDYPIAVIREPPVKKANEETRKGHPLEELDPGGKGKEAEGNN